MDMPDMTDVTESGRPRDQQQHPKFQDETGMMVVSKPQIRDIVRAMVEEQLGDMQYLAAESTRERESISAVEYRIMNSILILTESSLKAKPKLAHEPARVAFLADMDANSPTWTETQRSLRRKGLVTRVFAGYMQLTAKGKMALQAKRKTRNSQEITDMVT